MRVATGSWDKTARVWDVLTGEAVGAPLAHQNRVKAVTWSPGGMRIATASADGTARVWDQLPLDPGDAPRLAELAEADSDWSVNESGGLEPVDFTFRRARLNELIRSANAQGGENRPFTRFINWLVADPEKRPISPFSEMMPDDYVRQMITAGPQTKAEAQRLYPWHPLFK
jgi:dipeptidyl aminopeptidase/acylaminoacyl peptidase